MAFETLYERSHNEPAADCRHAAHLWAWSHPRRSFCTTTALAVVFVLGMFDLAFTQTQIQRGNFAEANILAMAFAQSPAGAAAYKMLCLGIGALILYRWRRHRASEVGVWFLLTAHVGLMIWWMLYLHTVELCAADPAVVTYVIPY